MIQDYWKIWVYNEEKSIEDLKTPDNIQSDDFSFEEAAIIAVNELGFGCGDDATLLMQCGDKFYEVPLQREWVCSHRQETTIDIITGNY
jgi:hypothetical protein